MYSFICKVNDKDDSVAKDRKVYACTNCGSVFPKWVGKCEGCGEWNTLVEEVISGSSSVKRSSEYGVDFTTLSGPLEHLPRKKSGIEEFDRVCGGGLVPGSVVLIGGDPGIGKSTLLLQAGAALSASYEVMYISGEESADQIRMRANRLGLQNATIQLATTGSVNDIIATLDKANKAPIVIIDSIQTMYLDSIDAAPGTVSQVRGCTMELIRVAKSRDIIIILVGHVTKEGMIAGPRILEHMVDGVFYFEGERGHHFRILRSVKNRFGATDEIGVFEMQDSGLKEVNNPSLLFLENRSESLSGISVFAGIEGNRPILCEIQGLVSPSFLASPRRTVVGWDSGRLSMLLAVLETRCGVTLSNKDVYLNIAGGLKMTEPAADLAAAASILSSVSHTPLSTDYVLIGEVGLCGEIRAVKQTEQRLKEAQKLGFKKAIVPASSQLSNVLESLQISKITHVSELLPLFNLPNKGRR